MKQTKYLKNTIKTNNSKSVRTISEHLDDAIVINKIEDITYDMFMDPELNSEFAKFDNESIVVNMDGSISVEIEIVDTESKPKQIEPYVVRGASFGEVLCKIYAIILATFDCGHFYEVRNGSVVKYLLKLFLKDLTEEDETKIHNMQDDVLDACFDGVDNVKDIVKGLKMYFK